MSGGGRTPMISLWSEWREGDKMGRWPEVTGTRRSLAVELCMGMREGWLQIE
jgi:hypothetical protein